MGYGNDDFIPVILGTGLGAYATARALHEAYGVRSLALGRAPLGETAHSAIIDVRVHAGFDHPDVVVAALHALADEFGGRTRVLFASVEYYTNVVIGRRDELEADYAIPLVDAAVKRRIIDKADFYRTCAELGVPHPQTVVVDPQAAGEASLGDDLPFGYPVILKPSDTDTYPRLSFEGQQKVYLVADARQLRQVVARILAAGYTGDLIVQEYLAGDESVMRVANTYSDRTGTMRLASLGQVALTEWNPRLVGNNNAIVSVHDEPLTASLRRFLDGIGYVGAANFDVMRDRRTGVDKLLEVNLRTGATAYYATAAGGNIPRCTVEEYVYGRTPEDTVTTEERLWVNAPYPVVDRFVPPSLRARVRAGRPGRSHTLRYRPDRSPRRRYEVARLDARRSLDYVRYAALRPRPQP